MKGKSILIVAAVILAGVGIYFAVKRAKSKKSEMSMADSKSDFTIPGSIPEKVAEHTVDFEVGEKFNYGGKVYQRTIDGWTTLS